jgi:hypothetical protein
VGRDCHHHDERTHNTNTSYNKYVRSFELPLAFDSKSRSASKKGFPIYTNVLKCAYKQFFSPLARSAAVCTPRSSLFQRESLRTEEKDKTVKTWSDANASIDCEWRGDLFFETHHATARPFLLTNNMTLLQHFPWSIYWCVRIPRLVIDGLFGGRKIRSICWFRKWQVLHLAKYAGNGNSHPRTRIENCSPKKVHKRQGNCQRALFM